MQMNLSITTEPGIASLPVKEGRGVLKPAATVCKGVHTSRSILFLVDQLRELGGGERALFALARELKCLGFRISVVTFQDHPDPAVFSLCDTITFLPLTSCFSLRAVRVALALRQFIRREHIDIVQTYFESADLFGALVARLSGVTCVLSSRRDMGILRARKHRLAYRLMGRSYGAVLAVSDQVRRHHITADRLREDMVHTIPNGIRLGQFDRPVDRDATRRALGLPVAAPLVLTLTNISPWKGVDVFLRAAALVHRVHPTAIFVVAGAWTDRALTTSLRARARSLDIADCTFFVGHVTDAPALLLSSDVFALLSRSEGMPNVVLEAMAARLPVVATAVGGTPEVVRDRVTGLLVAKEDADAAAACLSQLLADASLRKRMGLAGRDRVEAHFSMEQTVRRHVELYNQLLPIGNRQQRSA